MDPDPKPLHLRRSPRLQGYDYATTGAYFITICAAERQCVFGTIYGGCVQLSPWGHIIEEEWAQTAVVRPTIQLDAFVVMPNHLHGIIVLTEGAILTPRPAQQERFGKPVPGSVPTIVRAFKAAVSRRINAEVEHPANSIWQANYYEHIIRNEADLTRIREYIAANPMCWAEDEENPTAWQR